MRHYVQLDPWLADAPAETVCHWAAKALRAQKRGQLLVEPKAADRVFHSLVNNAVQLAADDSNWKAFRLRHNLAQARTLWISWSCSQFRPTVAKLMRWRKRTCIITAEEWLFLQHSAFKKNLL